jgi:hypothetical protein
MFEIAGGIILGFLGILAITRFLGARRAKKEEREVARSQKAGRGKEVGDALRAGKTLGEALFPGQTIDEALSDFPERILKELAPVFELRGADAVSAIREVFRQRK